MNQTAIDRDTVIAKLFEMNKVLINTPDLKNKGGVAQYYNVFELDKEPNIDYFNIHNSGGNRFVRLFRTYYNFIGTINSYDVIVINPSLNHKSFFRDAVFAYLAKRKNKKLLAFWMGWDDQYEKKLFQTNWLRTIFNKTYGKVDCFIVFGEIFKNKLLELNVQSNVKFYRETMSISEEWVSDFRIENKYIPFKTTELNILFLSRMVRAKGIYTCVDVAGILKEKFPDKKIILHMAGDGEELEKLKRYVVDGKIDNVIFYGDVRGRQKFDLFLNSDLFLFPTQHGEGFPNVVLESLFFGLPLITRPVAAIPDVIQNGKNGYLESGTNAQDFAQYICEYLQLTYEQRKQVAYFCHYDAVAKYSLKKVRQRTVDFYSNF